MATSKGPSRQSWVEAYVKSLLKSGEDVNQTDKNGVTPLHHAVRFRSPAAVRALLENGARVNQACKRSGSTPLHRAVTSTGAPGTAGKQEEASRRWRECDRQLIVHAACRVSYHLVLVDHQYRRTLTP